MRRLLVTVTVLACSLWATSVASAGTLGVETTYNSGYRLVWEGEPGEDNDVVFETGDNGTVIVRERSHNSRLVALPDQPLPCEVQDRVATCGPASFSEYVLRGNEGDDKISTQGLTGGWAGYFSDYIFGGGGHDVLDGADRDYCCGGTTIDPGHGDDVVRGGNGRYDTVSYSYRTADLDISLAPRPAGARNGEAGEHDVIGDDVESIQTGSGNDVVYGNDLDNSIQGGTGSDELHGLGGYDNLYTYSGWWDTGDDLYGGDGGDSFSTGPLHGVVDGGEGWDTTHFYDDWYMTLSLDGVANDGGIINEYPYWPQKRRTPKGELRGIESVRGGYVADHIVGDDKPNYIEGYRGGDVIVGGGGEDTIYADAYWYEGGGDDFVDVLDGVRDVVYCEGGEDTVVADPDLDALDSGCENVYHEKRPIPEIELPPDPQAPPAPVYDPGSYYQPSPVYPQPPGVPLPGQWFDSPPIEEPDAGRTGPPAQPSCAVLEATREPKKLAGGAEGECLVGAGGGDRLTGNAGNDQLVGGDGRDKLNGGAGDDWLDGGAEADSVDGGPHDDMVLGGKGPDTLNASSGDDVVIAADGARDRIDCGKGRDIAVVDRIDRVKRCEVVRRARGASKR